MSGTVSETLGGIETAGLTRRYGRTVAVEPLDLQIPVGGVIGILGPNGSGKSTLLQMLATVLSPSGGDLRLLGRDPSRSEARTAIRRRLGYLPQEPGLYGGFSVFDIVDYVAVLKEMTDRRARHDEVRRVIDAVDLTDAMHKKVRSLSGGMRQRAALAASLLGEPELLVLDEPATGLDPDQRLRLRSILSAHGRRGTVVLSTHHTAEVAACCQRVIVMLAGRVRFDGTPIELAQVAAGRVWAAPDHDVAADRSWLDANGVVRSIGEPPRGATMLEPTIDDGYLRLTQTGGRR